MQAPEALVQALASAKSVALLTHVNPDGDGLGSQAALAEGLAMRGVKVALCNQDPAPARYAFLGLERWPASPGPFDLALVMDTSALDRVGGGGGRGADCFAQSAAVGVVDHHASGKDGAPWAKIAWILPEAPATGMMTVRLLDELGIQINARMAGALYAALAYDTGCFRHSNTSAEAFALAGRLKHCGAETDAINRELFESRPLPAVKLAGLAMSAIQIGNGGRSAIVMASQEMMAAAGAKGEDCDGLVEAARAIQGVEVGCLLRQDKDTVKLSLRSKGSLDVNALAGKFGGGGHVRAAGATLRMGMAEAESTIKAALSAALG